MINKKALCLITYDPFQKLIYIDFLNNIVNYDIFVVIDKNNSDYSDLIQKYKNIKFILLDNNLCLLNGYKNLNFITFKKYVTGWDKAIYYFTNCEDKYDFVWFFEDDVFFFSDQILLDIDNKYINQDILCNCDFKEANLNIWLWNKIKNNYYNKPYYNGMMCIVRLSNLYLSKIKEHVNKYKTMFFLEAFYPIIAKKYNMSIIISPDEFSTVTYRDYFKVKFIIENKNKLYHPIKNIEAHSYLRNK